MASKSKSQKIREILSCYKEVINKKRDNGEEVQNTAFYNRYLELIKRKAMK